MKHEDFSKPHDREALNKSQSLGTIAILMSMIAFALSVSTPWIMDNYAPEPVKPALEETISGQMDIITPILEWAFGAQVPPESEETREKLSPENAKNAADKTRQASEAQEHWTEHWSMTVTILALFGIFFSVIALLQRENRVIPFTAMFFATAAFIAQHLMVAIIVGIIFILIIGLLSAMGVSFGA